MARPNGKSSGPATTSSPACLLNLVMYFIILTSAATLHAHGKTAIASARDAAEALRPVAGDGAYWLFSLGLIGACSASPY